MTEVLHVWALAPAAIGTCCLAADRRRARIPELVASVLMLAALRSPRRARGSMRPAAAAHAMTATMTLGLVLMAALAVVPSHAGTPAFATAGSGLVAHAHGVAADAVTLGVLVAVAIYAVWAARLALRMRGGLLERLQPAAMAVSVVAMSLASGPAIG